MEVHRQKDSKGFLAVKSYTYALGRVAQSDADTCILVIGGESCGGRCSLSLLVHDRLSLGVRVHLQGDLALFWFAAEAFKRASLCLPDNPGCSHPKQFSTVRISSDLPPFDVLMATIAATVKEVYVSLIAPVPHATVPGAVFISSKTELMTIGQSISDFLGEFVTLHNTAS